MGLLLHAFPLLWYYDFDPVFLHSVVLFPSSQVAILYHFLLLSTFVCFDTLRPSQHVFSQVGTFNFFCISQVNFFFNLKKNCKLDESLA